MQNVDALKQKNRSSLNPFKMQRPGKQAAAEQAETQSKRTVRVPVTYQESAFVCEYECDASTPLGDFVQLAAGKGQICARQQLNIHSKIRDWEVLHPTTMQTAGEFVDESPSNSIRMQLSPQHTGKGLLSQITRLKLHASRLKEDLATAEQSYEVLKDELLRAKVPSEGCRKCLQLEARMDVLEKVLQAKDRELEAKDGELEAKDRELEAKDRELEAKLAELKAQIDTLMKSAVRQHKLARRICVHDARQKITERIGRAISTNQTWKEYRASLSQQEQIRANVSDSAIWDKLDSGVKAGNRAAHVADEEEIAEALRSQRQPCRLESYL